MKLYMHTLKIITTIILISSGISTEDQGEFRGKAIYIIGEDEYTVNSDVFNITVQCK